MDSRDALRATQADMPAGGGGAERQRHRETQRDTETHRATNKGLSVVYERMSELLVGGSAVYQMP